jgi:endoglucanase
MRGSLRVAALGVSLAWLAGCATDTIVAVGDGAKPATPGPARSLHTEGSRVVDADGREVRLAAVSWFGLETPVYAPHGLWTRSMASVLDQIRTLGFNAIRVPISSELLDPGSTPNSIDYGQNPDLQGLDGLGILDRLVDGAASRGLGVLIDRHRPDSGGQSALWYTDRYSEARWLDDLRRLAAHFADRPAVIGFELHNDVRDPATWGDGNAATDWRAAAERAGNAVLGVNPNLLVVVEGVEHAGGTAWVRGGNLTLAGASPVELELPGHVVYATQDYPPSVEDHPWLHDPAYPGNLPALWDARWGYLIESDVAPVWLVGFGTRLQSDPDRQWLETLVPYLASHDAGFAYWCLNPDSGDTGGLLQDDWQAVSTGVLGALSPLLSPPPAR